MTARANWRDQLRPASYRGVKFAVSGHEHQAGGRRLVPHTYPNRDTPYIEDMGRKTKGWRIEGFVIGPNYMASRDALIEACNAPDAGVLIHPWLGSLRVICGDVTVSESSDEGGMARFIMIFSPAPLSKYPTTVVDTAALVIAAASTIIVAGIDHFARSFTVRGMPNFVANAALDHVHAALDTIGAVADILPGDTTSQIGTVKADLPALINDAKALARGISHLTNLVTSSDAAHKPAKLVDFGAAMPEVPNVTATRMVQRRNQSEVNQLIRLNGVAAQAKHAANTRFAAADDAFAARDTIIGNIDAALDTASAAQADDVFDGLQTMSAAVSNHINTQAPTLADRAHITMNDSVPAIVTAYDLHDDLAREAEIIARNNIRHPGMLPGGQPFEVLRHG